MKIAIVNKHKQDTLGGSEIQSDIIARKLTAFGHDVTYIAVTGKGKYQTDYRVIPVKNSADAILEAIDKCNPDIVYWRYNKHNLYSSVKAIKERNLPIVFAASGPHDLKKWGGTKAVARDKPFFKCIVVTIIRAIESRKQHRGLPLVDAVITNNKGFLKESDHPSTKFIRSSVEENIIPFKHDKPFIVWVSSLKPYKRPELCLELAHQIKDLDLDILVIGEILHENYSIFNNSESIPSNIKYLGKKPIEEVNGVIKASLAFLHTGKPEGFANTFMQSWILGKSVISFEYDPDGILEKEQIGFSAEGNLKKLIQNLSSLIDEPEKRKAMEKRAAHFAEKNFSPEHNVGLLEDFLEKVIREKRGK